MLPLASDCPSISLSQSLTLSHLSANDAMIKTRFALTPVSSKRRIIPSPSQEKRSHGTSSPAHAQAEKQVRILAYRSSDGRGAAWRIGVRRNPPFVGSSGLSLHLFNDRLGRVSNAIAGVMSENHFFFFVDLFI